MSREEHAPMPREILLHDKVRLHPERSGAYVRMYGPELKEKVWEVIHILKDGRKRLYVDDTPSIIYAGDAVLAYKGQSKARRDWLTSKGARLP